ncbi:hypothetical protein Tco_0154822 [Tanacetum coccineum]
MDEDLRKSYRTLEDRLFHEGRFVTPSFIEANNMLPTFQDVVKRDEEERPYIEFKLGQFTFNRFFGPKHDLVKKNITIPRTTQNQLQKDPKKLHRDDLHPELKGWELFFRENVFCILGNRDLVNACTAYMLYYLTIKRPFNLTTMILYLMEEVKKNSHAPMPFAMLLTRLYEHILETTPQSIVPLDHFTIHDRVMNPLDITRNTIKNKGKRVAPPSPSSSSSSSNENEEPSFLEFYEELSDNENLTDAQKEKREMFKCLNLYFDDITKYLKKQK